MTIVYTCKISASKDLSKPYETQFVEVKSEHCIPDNTLRKIVIDKLPKEYVSFGHMTIDFRKEGVDNG